VKSLWIAKGWIKQEQGFSDIRSFCTPAAGVRDWREGGRAYVEVATVAVGEGTECGNLGCDLGVSDIQGVIYKIIRLDAAV
jgi:hypothetical protein